MTTIYSYQKEKYAFYKTLKELFKYINYNIINNKYYNLINELLFIVVLLFPNIIAVTLLAVT